jgi:tetratricopeptide (TPR) repeat protein
MFAALGLMSKPMLVTLPFVLLLLDFWPLRRLGQNQNARNTVLHELPRLVVEKIPLFMMAIASSVITYYAQQGAGAMLGGQQLTWLERLANAAVGYASYLQKTLIPADLALFYPHPGQWPTSDVVVSMAALAFVSLLTLVMIKRAPYLFVGWAWFLGMLVPVIGFVQVGGQAAADRYTYLPSIGLSIAIVFSLTHLFERYQIRASIATSCAMLVLALYTAVAWQYTGHWKNSLTLWRHSLMVTDNNYLIVVGLVAGKLEPKPSVSRLSVPYMSIGLALLEYGRPDAALLHFEEANRLAPQSLNPLLHLGVLYAARDQPQKALTTIARLTDLYPQDTQAQEVAAAVRDKLRALELPTLGPDRGLPAAVQE